MADMIIIVIIMQCIGDLGKGIWLMMRRVFVVIIALYAVCMAGFIYFENINVMPLYANWIKFGGITLGALTAALLWDRSFNRYDATMLLIALTLTILVDVFLVHMSRTHSLYGMIVYCVIQSVYFMRYQYDKSRGVKWRNAFILPLFLIVPVIFTFLSRQDWFFLYGMADTQRRIVIVTTFYIQTLLAVIVSAARCVRAGRYPKINGRLILLALGIFVIADITVVLAQPEAFLGFYIPAMRRLIWIFYIPSQALLALSSYDYDHKAQTSGA